MLLLPPIAKSFVILNYIQSETIEERNCAPQWSRFECNSVLY
jgi:hypothetical protein